MDTNETIKISTLIKKLQEIQARFGDLPVCMSADSEGNSFGIISPEGEELVDAGSGVIVLYPIYNVSELDEIEGFTGYPDED